jgi:stage II sporulation SpoAA-like protein
MLEHELQRAEGLLVIRPRGPLQADDFISLAAVIDPYVEQHGNLRGLMIEASSFPGWDSFAAFVSHVRFVRDHHRVIRKVAAVSDSPILSIAPQLAKHFVKAEIRHFKSSERAAALAWLRE